MKVEYQSGGWRSRWKNLKPRKLSLGGERILKWLEDAETCIPVGQLDQLDDRLRVLTSDMLRCASSENVSDIGDAASEFARRHPKGADILDYLEPLVFPHLGTTMEFRLSPWQDVYGKLSMNDQWQELFFAARTGGPFPLWLLEQPVPHRPRTDLQLFMNQIIKESSRWQLPKSFVDRDHAK